MQSLKSLLNNFLENTISFEAFTQQYLDFWQEVREEQQATIDEQGYRPILNDLWQQYRSGAIDEVDYGMQWTEVMQKISNVRIPLHSIVNSICTDLYNKLTLYLESKLVDIEEVPTIEELREICDYLASTIDA